MMEMIVFSLCLYLETNNASSRHGHMENKANIIDDEDADGEDDDDDRLKNQANRLLDILEKKVLRLESIMVQNVIIIGRSRGEKCNNLVPGLFLYFTSGCHCCQFWVINHPTALKQHSPRNEVLGNWKFRSCLLSLWP